MSAPSARTATIRPAIMCGGSGTRLWPVSRENLPKQFSPLRRGLSTFQLTLLRFRGAEGFARPMVLAHRDFRALVEQQAEAVGIAVDLVLEPSRRDSAAAVAVATRLAAAEDPAALVLVLAADHLIEDVEGFLAGCRAAARAAATGRIMTMGIRPTAPVTSYGYIRPGEPIAGTEAFAVAAFVEKPDRPTAERYLAEGYLWNAGNFIFPAGLMEAELERHVPEIAASVARALESSGKADGALLIDADSFAQVPRTSIDYAVMERTAAAGVLPVAYDWSDVGSWHAMWTVSAQDEAGNAVEGTAHLAGVRGSLVRADGILTAVVGLEDAVVVATPDAVLVAARGQAEKVKDIVAHLKAAGHPAAERHPRESLSWGSEEHLHGEAGLGLRRLTLRPGAVAPLPAGPHVLLVGIAGEGTWQGKGPPQPVVKGTSLGAGGPGTLSAGAHGPLVVLCIDLAGDAPA